MKHYYYYTYLGPKGYRTGIISIEGELMFSTISRKIAAVHEYGAPIALLYLAETSEEDYVEWNKHAETKMTHDEMIIQAHKQGKTLQYRTNNFGEWVDMEKSWDDFHFDRYEYRIKPDPGYIEGYNEAINDAFQWLWTNGMGEELRKSFVEHFKED